jgi:hypothetical protein
MLNDRKRQPLSNPEVAKATLDARKSKKIKVSIIFNQSTHRMIKAIAATEGGKISDLIEGLAQQYLKERGKL